MVGPIKRRFVQREQQFHGNFAKAAAILEKTSRSLAADADVLYETAKVHMNAKAQSAARG
jgi:hypothetical protein